MKTGNFARVVVSTGLPFPVGPQDWLISITDWDGQDALPANDFGKTLFVKFDDTNTVTGREISQGEAFKIAQFIKLAREHSANVWVNCHAGICRSGAVVSLLIDLGWEDARCHMSPGRIPNTLVYDKVRQHFPEVRHSWDPPLAWQKI